MALIESSIVAPGHVRASSAQLAIDLEPVYAIAPTILLFGEPRDLSPQFSLGFLVLLGAVLLLPRLGRRFDRFAGSSDSD
jgi:hypothetical protein